MDTLCFNDSSDCVLIIEIENHPKMGVGYPGVGFELCCRVIKLHVNSVLLAGKSPFFRDLFTNAMMESEERCATMHIDGSDETAVMEVLNFMYSDTLTATTEPVLLDVLKLADKFQVASCMRLCAGLLIEMPVTTESALIYLGLVMAHEVQYLVDAAKQFVATQLIEIDEHWSEIMKVTLAGMEAILSSDFLQTSFEDHVFEIARTWVKQRYSEPEEQRRIFSTNLARYIRFPYLTSWKLTKVMSSDVLEHDFAHKAVVDALAFRNKETFPHYPNAETLVEDSTGSTSHRPYVRRAYFDRLVKAFEFELPCPEVVVYFDLCAPFSSSLSTEEFTMGTHWFSLFVARDRGSSSFAVYLQRNDEDDECEEPLALEYEFASRSKFTKEFVPKSSGAIEIHQELKIYETPWLDFEAGESLDFVDGVLYLEFKLRRVME